MTTIEHDPESGCAGCPFCIDEMGPFCQAERRDVPPTCLYNDLDTVPESAPGWCPLYSGPVTVRALEGRA